MAVIKTDTFTEGSDTALESHSSDVGSGWNVTALQTDEFDVIAADDEVANDGVGSRWAGGDEDPSTADYFVEVNERTVGTSGDDRCGAIARTDGSPTKDFYQAYLQGTGNLWLHKYVANTITTLDDGAYVISGFSESTYYDVKLECIGTAIKAYLDDVEVRADTDSDITRTGNVGIHCKNANARITSLNAEEAGVGADVRRHIIPAYMR